MCGRGGGTLALRGGYRGTSALLDPAASAGRLAARFMTTRARLAGVCGAQGGV